jgi:GNAT superfamily N-acetyltransferase
MNGYTIRVATQGDLFRIRDWLEQEHNDGVEGCFFYNYNLIKEGLTSGSLTVLVRESDELPIAFALGENNIDIFAVKYDCRKQGFGRYLAQHIIDRSRQRDVIGMYGECAPSTSKKFWQRMGFSSVEPPYGGDNPNWVAYPLPHERTLPEGPRLSVVVCVDDYHESMKGVFQSDAIKINDHYLLVMDFVQYIPQPDQNLEVSCDGKVIFRNKNKYVSEIGGERHAPWVRLRQIFVG